MTHYQALVIEDDVYSGEILADLLKRQGVTVITLQNVQQVLPTLATLKRLDLIFLDLELREFSGYEVFDAIRAVEGYQQTPIVAYSSYVNEKATTRQYGFHGFLSKPIFDESFASQLTTLLQGESVWD